MKTYLPLLGAMLLVMLAGCSQSEERSNDSTPRKKSANQQRPGCFGLINGQETTDYQPVGMIVRESSSGIGSCTGTFVSDHAMVTASHCVFGSTGRDIFYLRGNTVDITQARDLIRSSSAVRSLQVVANRIGGDATGRVSPTEVDLSQDIAIIIFPPNTAPRHLAIRKTPPTANATIEMVGFGLIRPGATHFEQIRKKRVGRNTLVSDPRATVNFPDIWIVTGNEQPTSAPVPSMIAKGDSGGPMLFGGVVIGVTSGSGYIPTLRPVVGDQAVGLYASVFGGSARAIFSRAEALGARITYSDTPPTALQNLPVAQARPIASRQCL